MVGTPNSKLIKLKQETRIILTTRWSVDHESSSLAVDDTPGYQDREIRLGTVYLPGFQDSRVRNGGRDIEFFLFHGKSSPPTPWWCRETTSHAVDHLPHHSGQPHMPPVARLSERPK